MWARDTRNDRIFGEPAQHTFEFWFGRHDFWDTNKFFKGSDSTLWSDPDAHLYDRTITSDHAVHARELVGESFKVRKKVQSRLTEFINEGASAATA